MNHVKKNGISLDTTLEQFTWVLASAGEDRPDVDVPNWESMEM